MRLSLICDELCDEARVNYPWKRIQRSESLIDKLVASTRVFALISIFFPNFRF